MDLGTRIRNIRKSQNISIKDLSEKVKVSQSMISQIEKGHTNPSMSCLKDIAAGLGITIGSLFYEEVIPAKLTKKNERKVLFSGKNFEIRQELLSPNITKCKMEFIYNEWQPGASSGLLAHDGEEATYVLEGTMEVVVGEETFIVEEGDSIYYEANSTHCVKNIGNKVLKMLTVITPPSF